MSPEIIRWHIQKIEGEVCDLTRLCSPSDMGIVKKAKYHVMNEFFRHLYLCEECLKQFIESLDLMKCEVCGVLTNDGQTRATLIGWICPKCFPTYINIQEKLKKSCRKAIERQFKNFLDGGIFW